VAHEALDVRLVSPERPLYGGKARSLVAETSRGEMGILPGHAALVTLLGTGEVRVRVDRGEGREGTDRFAIRGGFLQVGGDRVTLLVTDAVRAEEVDPAKVRAEREGVLEGLRSPKSDAEYRELLDLRRWADARLRIAEG